MQPTASDASSTPAREFLAGATAIAPAVIAMVPFALILGQQAAAKGLSPLEMLAMSSIVFAGSSQFLAVSLWSFPAPVAALALAALLINLRHVLMGASLAGKVGHFPKWMRVVGPYFMADETWAVVERRALATRLTPAYYFGAALTLFGCWQIGTVLGTFLGALIDDPVRLGFDFAFPAIFISLALGFWKGARQTGPVMVAAAVVAVAVHAVVPGAWYVVAGALAGIAAAVITTPHEAVTP
ncbi:AzlC family ABC transporter permease [Oryzibacter oryziterrae]|uniref:AzlC family ABC transporter permease n=1 Tax=Oryzibacter oryziterrae TaxID=2766474 RepID=UPI001F3CF53D|nr:AzlC family ABC transporter permease [Oryzibacter oryziterrae]